MTQVVLSGQLVCADDAELAVVQQHLPRHVELTRAEPGCVSFEVHQTGDALVWQVDETFVDDAAFAAHQERVSASEWGRVTAAIERRYAVTSSAPHVVLRPDEEGVNGYRLLTALVLPRPIAWVSSISADGIGNLAPHSFFTVASAEPPIVQFTSVGAKDTLRNVVATREFTISLASRPLIDQVNASSATYDADVDEAEELGIAMSPSAVVAPPRVAASPASLECRLHDTLVVGDSTLVLGEVVAVTVDPAVLVDGRPVFDRLAPLSRLGGSEWGLPPEVVRVTRPR